MLLLSLRPLVPFFLFLFLSLGNTLTLAKTSEMQNASHRKIHLSVSSCRWGRTTNKPSTLSWQSSRSVHSGCATPHRSVRLMESVCLCWGRQSLLTSLLRAVPWSPVHNLLQNTQTGCCHFKSLPGRFLPTETARFGAARG